MCHQGGLGAPQLTMNRLDNLNAMSSEMAGTVGSQSQSNQPKIVDTMLNRGSEFGKIESGNFEMPEYNDGQVGTGNGTP